MMLLYLQGVTLNMLFVQSWGWSGGAMVLGKLPVPGRPTIWMIVGQGPIALAVGAGGGGLHIFTLIYPFSPLSPHLWETARYRLKYCLKGPLNPKQPTNQIVQSLIPKDILSKFLLLIKVWTLLIYRAFSEINRYNHQYQIISRTVKYQLFVINIIRVGRKILRN